MKKPYTRSGIRFYLVAISLILGQTTLNTVLAGLPVLYLGALLHLWAKGCLHQNEEVTRTGPYRFVRHPFYLAYLLIDIGVVVMSGSLLLAAVFPFWWLAIYIPTIRKEEAYLGKLYPEELKTFRQTIPALFPIRKPLPKSGKGFSWNNPNIATGNEIPRFLRILAYPLLFFVVYRLRTAGSAFFADGGPGDVFSFTLMLALYGASWLANKHFTRRHRFAEQQAVGAQRNMKYRLKHLVEYGALKSICGLLNLLPEQAAMRFGIGLAWLAKGPMRSRIHAARDRIREVFGSNLSDKEVKRIAWISLRNTFLNGVEVIRMGKIDRAWAEQHIADLNSIEPLRAHLQSGRGAILVVPHMGNWDLAAVVTRLLDLPVFLIVGHQKNPLTDAYINRMRRKPGIETISRHDGPLRQAIRRLRAGQVLAFMTDTRSRAPGVYVSYLGKEANVVGGMALFARQADVPVFPAVTIREGTYHHRWKVFEPIYPDNTLDKQEDARRMTQAVMNVYDREVRARPDQYFWYNKRWVLEPWIEPETQTLDVPQTGRPLPAQA